MSHRDPLEARLRRLRPAPPSVELKRRVLREAARLDPGRPSRLEALWFSRPLRLAAAAFVGAVALFTIVENRAVERRLEEAFGSPRPERGESFTRLAEELGLDPALSERFRRAGERTFEAEGAGGNGS